jgi:hypothetical protein
MRNESAARNIVVDGPNAEEVLNVLGQKIDNAGKAKAIDKARRILELSVDPTSGGVPQPSDGLLYGLIQSGKTSILTLASGMAVDNGFDCVVVLTSDNDLLYGQTKDRIVAALGGLTVLGKKDWIDPARFAKQIKAKPFAIVCSKNGSMLNSLVESFKKAKAKSLSLLIVDDEADQASLDTTTSKPTGKPSPINLEISALRKYFPVNTYLQVTGTPQALFLQRPNHEYRPNFTVLTEPGPDYVGGDAFFSTNSKLLQIVDINETTQLTASGQPNPNGDLPSGLKRALCTFFVGAAARVIANPSENYAFLLHVSMSNADHEFARQLLDDFKQETSAALKKTSGSRYTALLKIFENAYADLLTTEPGLPPFAEVLTKITFYMSGANIKLINASSSHEIKLDSRFNLFVGGNKLGRGVTIENLLVSYYGRNPKRPNADTVLQHARMYGYRKKDLGLTRLFLPQRLADNFRTIHEMESSLRDYLGAFPDGSFEGLFISGNWNPTRKNVLDPSSLGQYLGGGSVNPSHPLRTPAAVAKRNKLDKKLENVPETKDGTDFTTINTATALEILEQTELDSEHPSPLWNMAAIKASLDVLKRKKGQDGKLLFGDKVYLVVKRDRDLKAIRGERAGIISGTSGDDKLAPTNAPTLFMYRTTKNGEEEAVWWPQLRFPKSNFVLWFAFDW